MAQSQSITLHECLAQTRMNFPTLKKKEIIKTTNTELQRAIWNSYFPQISLDGSASYQSDVTGMELEMPSIEVMPGTPPRQLPPIDFPKIPKFQFNSYLQATQLIWDGGSVRALGKEIESGSESQLAQTDIEIRKVEESVLELYFSLLMVEAQMNLQSTLIEEINRQIKKVENALTNGIATHNDLDEVSVERLKANQVMDQLISSRSSIIQALSIFTGLNLDHGLTALTPEFPLVPVQSPSQRLASLRPEHQLLDTEAKKADASLDTFFAEGMPKIALFARAGYGRPGLNMLNPKASSYFAYGVKLHWNFGRLYGLKAKKQQRDGTIQLVQLQRNALEKEIAGTLAKLQGEYKQYEAMLAQDNEIIALRTQIAERAKLLESEGQLSTIGYLEKITALNSAKQTRDIHRIQLLKSQYKILQTYGVQMGE